LIVLPVLGGGVAWVLLATGTRRLSASPLRLAAGFLGGALMPAALGAFVSFRGVVRTFGALALTGSGGAGALAAGIAESLLPLVVALWMAALVGVAGLAALGWALRRPRAARSEAPLASKPAARGTLPLVVLAAGSLGALLVALASVRGLLGVIADAIGVAGGWAPPGSVEEAARSLASHLGWSGGLALAAQLVSAALLLVALFWNPEVEAERIWVKGVAIALLVTVVGWALSTAIRVGRAERYLQEIALSGRATQRHV